MLDFVEAEDGGMHMNQASILHNMMPIVQLFRLFYGYPAMRILILLPLFAPCVGWVLFRYDCVSRLSY